jgi:hypothetical protein
MKSDKYVPLFDFSARLTNSYDFAKNNGVGLFAELNAPDDLSEDRNDGLGV